MSLDEAKTTDSVTEVEGIRFIVDESLNKQYEGLRVDYRRSLFGKGFAIALTHGGGGCCS